MVGLDLIGVAAQGLVGQNPRAVRSLPPEEVVGEGNGRVIAFDLPLQLVRYEVLDPHSSPDRVRLNTSLTNCGTGADNLHYRLEG